jgi:hypothetical protein
MFSLFGLLCFNVLEPITCSQKEWEENFYTIEECEKVGKSQINMITQYGIVVDFKCEPSGEMT